MNKASIIFHRSILSFLVIFAACARDKQPFMRTKPLDQDWQFVQAGEEQWRTARVPGTVHTDLLRHELIKDPFYRLNEHQVQWVDKKDWVYKTEFSLDPDILNKDRIVLRFEGLDTYADVYVNHQKILEADNMFRGWEVNAKEHLTAGPNELKIYFHSPIKVGLEKYDNYPHVVHSSANDLAEIGQVPGNKWVSPHVRKAHSHFGWDWGPRLVTSGIWQPVYLAAWDVVRITDLRVVQQKLKEQKAVLTAEVEIEAIEAVRATLGVRVNGKEVRSQPVTLDAGKKLYSLDFEIANPELWWSNGLGEAYLYDIEAVVETPEGTAARDARIGLRTLEVVREKDEQGTSFYLKLNGHPVFMKGANYIPADAFLDRVTPEKYEKIIRTAKESNFNMLRVWGGGIYEKDLFYDLCDQYGILVWQDFMFACNMYPGHPGFLESVKQEAEYNIKRLRNHPSLALWCGNNEVLAAWLSWGWSKEVEKEDPDGAKAQWKAYKDIFLDILPKAVAEHDPGRFYWASSPQSGDTLKVDYINGDEHYWGVWWGKEPFSSYHTKIARFMSEYGFQSFPEWRTVQQYTREGDWDIYSEVMQSHQRSSIGNGTIELYMLRHYRKPKDFQSFLYVGQVLQAEGMKQGMEGHRIAMPYNMGSLYWQINDCWPVASWSSTDYYARWKAMQYFSKKAFAEVLVAPRVEGDSVMIYCVSDRLRSFKGNMKIMLLDLKGTVLSYDTLELDVKENTSEQVFSQSKEALLKGKAAGEVMMRVILEEDGEPIASNQLYFTPVKEIVLPSPTIKSKVERTAQDYAITLETDVLAKNVWLSYEGHQDGFFSDNYFDLFPGEEVTVRLTHADEVGDLEGKLVIRTLADTY